MTHKPTSARPLTFQDLEDIVVRLRNDPRVHPSTPIEIVVEVERDDDLDADSYFDHVTKGLGAVSLGHGKITLGESESVAGGVAFAQ